ncbi:MAG TPA: ferritin family protein, partial [Xanthobacteraceae bacterium]
MPSQVSKTDLNLWLAFVDEAKTHRLYAAYAIQAMGEGHLEAAEAFMEAAGAEIVHAMTHLKTLGAVKSTAENLRSVVQEEAVESEQTYPRYIAEARAEGRADAVRSFELALARERQHIALFQA